MGLDRMMLITAACVIHPSPNFHHKLKPDNQQSSSLQYNAVQCGMGGAKALTYVTLVNTLQEVAAIV